MAVRERPYDRSVILRPNEKVLLVDGDDELFVTQTERGVRITDARGFRASLVTDGEYELVTEGVLVKSASRA